MFIYSLKHHGKTELLFTLFVGALLSTVCNNQLLQTTRYKLN